MEFVDYVQDQVSAPGTGDFTCDAVAPSGYATVVDSHTGGAKVSYIAVSGSDRETGRGTVSIAAGVATVSRDAVKRSTNSNAKVNFTGTVDLMTGPIAADMAEVPRRINTLAAAGEAELIDTTSFVAGYSNIDFLINLSMPNLYLNMYLSSDGGETWSTAYEVVIAIAYDGLTEPTLYSAEATEIPLSFYTVDNRITGRVSVANPSNSDGAKFFDIDTNLVNSTLVTVRGAGMVGASEGPYPTDPVNAVKFAPDSDVFTDGVITVYGWN